MVDHRRRLYCVINESHACLSQGDLPKMSDFIPRVICEFDCSMK